MNYRKATLPDGSRVTLYARGNEGTEHRFEVVDVHREGSSGLVRVGTIVARQRFRAGFYFVG